MIDLQAVLQSSIAYEFLLDMKFKVRMEKKFLKRIQCFL